MFERMITNTLISKANSISPREDMAERVKSAVISGPKKRSSLLRRSASFCGKVAAVVALFVVTLVFHGNLMAMAGDAADNIIKILNLGNYSSVIQVEDKASNQQALSQEQKDELLKGGTITIQTPDGAVVIKGKDPSMGAYPEGTVPYSSLIEAQKGACFKVLSPGYLPSGYAFKEARGFKDSKYYMDLYFTGPGKDIVLSQRMMNQETGFVLGTNGPVESVDINGVTGAWVEPHSVLWEKDGVSYDLICKGFSKEEIVQVARSIK